MFAVVLKKSGRRYELLSREYGVVTGIGKKRRQNPIEVGMGVEIEYVPDHKGRYKIIRVFGHKLKTSSRFIVISTIFVSSFIFR